MITVKPYHDTSLPLPVRIEIYCERNQIDTHEEDKLIEAASSGTAVKKHRQILAEVFPELDLRFR